MMNNTPFFNVRDAQGDISPNHSRLEPLNPGRARHSVRAVVDSLSHERRSTFPGSAPVSGAVRRVSRRTFAVRLSEPGGSGRNAFLRTESVPHSAFVSSWPSWPSCHFPPFVPRPRPRPRFFCFCSGRRRGNEALTRSATIK